MTTTGRSSRPAQLRQGADADGIIVPRGSCSSRWATSQSQRPLHPATLKGLPSSSIAPSQRFGLGADTSNLPHDEGRLVRGGGGIAPDVAIAAAPRCRPGSASPPTAASTTPAPTASRRPSTRRPRPRDVDLRHRVLAHGAPPPFLDRVRRRLQVTAQLERHRGGIARRLAAAPPTCAAPMAARSSCCARSRHPGGPRAISAAGRDPDRQMTSRSAWSRSGSSCSPLRRPRRSDRVRLSRRCPRNPRARRSNDPVAHFGSRATATASASTTPTGLRHALALAPQYAEPHLGVAELTDMRDHFTGSPPQDRGRERARRLGGARRFTSAPSSSTLVDRRCWPGRRKGVDPDRRREHFVWWRCRWEGAQCLRAGKTEVRSAVAGILRQGGQFAPMSRTVITHRGRTLKQYDVARRRLLAPREASAERERKSTVPDPIRSAPTSIATSARMLTLNGRS